ncbi:MAG: hypothetical protein AB1816_03280 [Bacillota bacterium]
MRRMPLKDWCLKDAVEMSDVKVLAPGVSVVCTYNGWYVVGAVPDPSRDALYDVPILGGPFPNRVMAEEWWRKGRGGRG